MSARLSWEEAVRWFRGQPGNEEAVRANYFDLPVRQAAERYATSEEFAEVWRLLGASGHILDLGAGNGVASFALARAGWQVTALEPDPSDEVGAGAIRKLGIAVTEDAGERLPFADATFEAVFARQVLHHVPDLAQTMRELHRVLRPEGVVLAIREHVVRDARELAAFRAQHPLHRHYGGENAHSLDAYLGAARAAGFTIREVWGPIESILNFAPGSEVERQRWVRHAKWRHWCGLGWLFQRAALRANSRRNRTPGRLYSFLLAK
ncbi:MAG: class I SAM-dependent methyltransferase [Chthoniobacteraceae bacterium]